MHVLALSSLPPLPLNSALRKRTWHLLRNLGERDQVTLVTWVPPGFSPELVNDMRLAFSNLTLLPMQEVDKGIRARLRRQARFFVGAPPPYVQQMLEERYLDSDEGRVNFIQELTTIQETVSIDVVVLEEEALGCLPLNKLGVPVVLHRLNVFARVIRELRRKSAAGFLRWVFEAPLWRRFDRVVLEDVTLAVAPTPEVAGEIRAIKPSLSVGVVSSGADVRPLARPPRQGRDVAFIGWMGYPPNVDAVVWFSREVWPEIRARFPESRLRIIGRDPASQVESLASEGIAVLGEVGDVTQACEGVRIGVVPLRAGMGIKTKALELMNMGLPVVATPTGAEGIGAGTEDGLIVAEDGSAFVKAMMKLINDDEMVDRLGNAARAFVMANFSWEAMGARYRGLLENLVARRAV